MTYTPTIHTEPGKNFSVCGSDGLILEVFATKGDATAFVAEWAAQTPTTYGQRMDLAAKHNALHRSE